MKSFSQRKGIKPVSELIQADSMSDELRNSLWNALDVALWSTENYLYKQYGEPFIDPFSRSLWFNISSSPLTRDLIEASRSSSISGNTSSNARGTMSTTCW